MTSKTTAEFIAEARVICEKATPTHDEDQPDEACAACGDIPDTGDREWDRGDLCWTCQADVFNPLRTILPEALDRLEAAESQLALLRMRDPASVGFQEQLFAEVKNLGELREEHEALRELYLARKEIDERELSSLRAENERLRAENARLNNECMVEVASHNQSVMDYMKHWEGRTLKAEAELSSLRAENAGLRPIVVAVEIQLGIRKSLMASGSSTAAESCTNVVDLLCKILKSGRGPKT